MEDPQMSSGQDQQQAQPDAGRARQGRRKLVTRVLRRGRTTFRMLLAKRIRTLVDPTSNQM